MPVTASYDWSDPSQHNQALPRLIGLARRAFPTLTQAPADVVIHGSLAELIQDLVDGQTSTAGHTHPIADIINLQSSLDAKAALVHTHVIGDVLTLASTLAGKADLVHAHVISDVTGLQTALDAKAALVHIHAIADVTALQATLDGKAASSHTHAAADVNSGTLAPARLGSGTPDSSTILYGDNVWRAAPAGSSAATTATPGVVKVDNNSSGDPVALTSAGHGAASDPHTQYALDADKGAANGYPSLDAGTKVPIAQIPTGTTGTTVPFGNDSRFSDSRTPTAHATSHKSGGSDAIKLDELAATTDVTTGNSSTSAHGLLPKLDSSANKSLRGDGTWGGRGNIGNALTAATLTVNAADTYITGSNIPFAGLVKAGTCFRWAIRATKTAAGAATPIFNVRIGTNASTVDTARTVTTGVVQTGAADEGWITVEVIVKAVGASGNIETSIFVDHRLATTGFQNTQCQAYSTTSSAFDTTTASTQIGLSINSGSLGVWTIQHVTAEAWNLN